MVWHQLVLEVMLVQVTALVQSVAVLLKSVQGLYPQDLPLRVALVLKTLDLSMNQQPRDQGAHAVTPEVLAPNRLQLCCLQPLLCWI